jgi:hypothetical protein
MGYFGAIAHTVIIFLKYTKGLSQFLWVLELETLVENILKSFIFAIYTFPCSFYNY